MVRVKDWLYSFIPMIFGNLYLWIYIFNLQFNSTTIVLLLLSLIVSVGFAAMGYFINEFFDRAEDEKAGKINVLAEKKAPYQFMLLSICSALAFLPWFVLPLDRISIFLITIQVISFLIYSVKPLRLKKVFAISNLIDAAYAYAIPLALSAYTFYLFSNQIKFPTYLITYLLLFTIVGFRNILIHQIDDVFYDNAIKINTMPKKLGVKKTNNLLKLLITLEFILLNLFVFLLANHVNIYFILLIIPVFSITLSLFTKKKKMLSKFIVFFETREGYNTLYQIWLPFIFIGFLLTNSIWWAVIIPFHLALFSNKKVLSKIYHTARNLLSVLINFSIYYLFRIFGVNLVEEEKDAFTYLKSKW